jgi:hypothetical protein
MKRRQPLVTPSVNQEIAMSYDAPNTKLLHRRALLAVAGATAFFTLREGSLASTHHSSDVSVEKTQAWAQKIAGSYKKSQTAAALRDVWIGHIFWVRAVSVATIEKNGPAARAAEQQAVSNARAIAATIEPFYGAAAKDQFFKLLAEHYGAIKNYLVAIVAGDGAAQPRAIQALTTNAESIATFLSKANPHLDKGAVQELLLAHGGHHIRQIQQLRQKEYEQEAVTWEEMKEHVYVIADATADALAKQFIKKFSCDHCW